MKVVTTQESSILTPNKEHQNFTSTGVSIPSGTILYGNNKIISGLRRGQPFAYKLFVTDKNQIIYQNTTKPMDTTEVTLGADASQTPTRVNLIPAEMYSQDKLIGVILGGLGGFAWAKYKKHDMKRLAMYVGVGALVGWGAAYVIDTRKSAVIKKSK